MAQIKTFYTILSVFSMCLFLVAANQLLVEGKGNGILYAFLLPGMIGVISGGPLKGVYKKLDELEKRESQNNNGNSETSQH